MCKVLGIKYIKGTTQSHTEESKLSTKLLTEENGMTCNNSGDKLHDIIPNSKRRLIKDITELDNMISCRLL